MRVSRIAVPALLMLFVVAGCGDVNPGPTASAAAVATASPSSSPPPSTEPSAAPPTTGPAISPTPSAAPSPSSTPVPSPPPTSSPEPPSPGPSLAVAAWRTITWQRVPADSPLAEARIVMPWRGGDVAVGRALGGTDLPDSRVWVSPDGTGWTELPADTFGPGRLVISVVAMEDGVAALTLASGGPICDDPPDMVLSCFALKGPATVWTSTDGTSWTAHEVSGVVLPRSMTGEDDNHVVLDPGAAPALFLRSSSALLAVSTDGVDWTAVRQSTVPRRFFWPRVVAYGGEFVAVGSNTTRGQALSSVGGRRWTATPMPVTCGGPTDLRSGGAIEAASDGLIAQGTLGTGAVVFCRSSDGRTWKVLPHYGPLGASTKRDECRGVCANGIVVSDGTAFLAYRGYRSQAGWVSSDGLHWHRLGFAGSRPTGWNDATYPYTLTLLPDGVLAQDPNSGAAWFGAASR